MSSNRTIQMACAAALIVVGLYWIGSAQQVQGRNSAFGAIGMGLGFGWLISLLRAPK